MNTINSSPKPKSQNPLPGDLFRDGEEGPVHLLAKLSDAYVAVSLIDGNRWDNPWPTPEKAVDGLTFLGRNAKISITF